MLVLHTLRDRTRQRGWGFVEQPRPDCRGTTRGPESTQNNHFQKRCYRQGTRPLLRCFSLIKPRDRRPAFAKLCKSLNRGFSPLFPVSYPKYSTRNTNFHVLSLNCHAFFSINRLSPKCRILLMGANFHYLS